VVVGWSTSGSWQRSSTATGSEAGRFETPGWVDQHSRTETHSDKAPLPISDPPVLGHKEGAAVAPESYGSLMENRRAEREKVNPDMLAARDVRPRMVHCLDVGPTASDGESISLVLRASSRGPCPSIPAVVTPR